MKQNIAALMAEAMKLYELLWKMPSETLPHFSTSADYRYTYDICRRQFIYMTIES